MPKVTGKRPVYNDTIEIEVPDEIYARLASLGLSTRLTNTHAGKSYTPDGILMTGIKHGSTIKQINAASPGDLTVEREAAKKTIDNVIESLENGTASFGGGGFSATDTDHILHDIISRLFRNDNMSSPTKICESLAYYEKIETVAADGDPSAAQLLDDINEQVEERLKLQQKSLNSKGSISSIFGSKE